MPYRRNAPVDEWKIKMLGLRKGLAYGVIIGIGIGLLISCLIDSI